LDLTNTRERILEAASELYRDLGHTNVRVADIVAKAHVSRRTMYRHFRDLDDLRFAVYERAIGVAFANVAELAGQARAVDRLERVLEALFGQISANPTFLRMVAYELRLPHLPNVALRQVVVDFLAGLLRDVVVEQNTGGAPPVPDILMLRALVAAIEGLVIHFVEAEAERAREAIPVVLRLVRALHVGY
jgi:AcrR family transcriptional regulator